MATISTTISLVDNMSAGLQRIGGAAEDATARVAGLDRGVRALQSAMDGLGGSPWPDAPSPMAARVSVGYDVEALTLPDKRVTAQVGYALDELTLPEARVTARVGYALDELTLPDKRVAVGVDWDATELTLEKKQVTVGLDVDLPESVLPEGQRAVVGLDWEVPELTLPEEQLVIGVRWEAMAPPALDALAGMDPAGAAQQAMAAGEAIGAALPGGLARGIGSGAGEVIAAMTAQASGLLEAGRGLMNTEAGAALGAALASGVAAGVASGTGAVVSAMERLMSRALTAARSAADIHSPSGETAWMGEMLVQGLAEGLESREARAVRAAEGVMRGALGAWDEGLWQRIGAISAMENEDLRHAGERGYQRKISGADAQRLRELAEREVIHRFHTAEVKVDFTANNTISSELDIDSVVEALEERVAERLEAVAEGVYD